MEATVIRSGTMKSEPSDGTGRWQMLLGSMTAGAGIALILAAMFVFDTPDSVGPSYVLGMLIIPIGATIALYPAGEGTMRCPYCRSANPSDSKSCSSCGREPFIIWRMGAKRVAAISERRYLARLGLLFAALAPAYLFFIMVDLAFVVVLMLLLQSIFIFSGFRDGRSFVTDMKEV